MKKHPRGRWNDEHLSASDRQKNEKIQAEFVKIQTEEQSRLKEHLETFNDGVIAIIITIMVLEVPLPSDGQTSYLELIRSLIVFLISFFIVANFWYQHHRTFGMVKQATRSILLTNFLFLAALSVLPLMTKWIMQEQDSLAIVNFGVVYFVANLMELIMYRFAFLNLFGKSETAFHFSNRITIARIWGQLLLNILLILIALKWPPVAMVLYLSLPIIAFFFPDQTGLRRQKKVRVKAALTHEEHEEQTKNRDSAEN